MSKSTSFSTSLLNHIFNNADIANVGDATGLRGSTAAGSLYVALHTASPGAGGNQTTNEATYTGYARVAVARSAGGWTITGASVSPTSVISFPLCTAGSNVITHVSVGTLTSGTGQVMYYGSLTSSLTVTNGVTPQLTSTSAITEA